MSLLDKIDSSRIPAHVAIIMDGNGRWAKSRGLNRSEGHVEGVKSVRTITQTASDLGVKHLTLYTFSTENWNRPRKEVDALMYLIGMAIERETPDLIKNNVRLDVIGDLDRVPEEARQCLQRCMDATAHCTGLRMHLAISYSSRWEITEAVRRIARQAVAGGVNPDDITELTVSENLATADIPDPDLLIRTGGDKRISNYLLWQIAYSELFFDDAFWPDYGPEHFYQAILSHQNRERRFGKTSEQLK